MPGSRPAASASAPASGRRPAARTRRLLVLCGLAIAAASAAIVLLTGGGAPTPSPAGLPDPGRITGWGLPAAGVLADLAAVLALGCALGPVLAGHHLDDAVEGPSLRALAAFRTYAFAWCAAAMATVALQVSDQFAAPVWELAWGTLRGAAIQTTEGKAMLWQAALAGAVALASRWALTVREVWWLLAVSVLALLPPMVAGHAASGGSHDTAVVSLAFHVVAASLWLGGLASLWWFWRAEVSVRERVVRRFAVLAAWCVGVVAISGLINAWVRVGALGALVTTDYGRIALVKVGALAVVSMLAVRARRIVVTASSDDTASWIGLARLTGVESLTLAAVVGIGVGLSRTPPPVGDLYTSVAENLLSGPMPAAPSLDRLLTAVNASGVGLAVVLMGTAGYLAGIRTLRRRGERWPWRRTLAWFTGLIVIAYATCGGIGVYSHVMFSAHMVSHMLLSMIAPLLLVLGAPIPLALRALPGGDAPGATGPRQLLADVLRSRPVRLLSHPLIAATLFVGSLYVVYLTSIFDSLMLNHLGHAAMELHFLGAGLLFYENLIGTAPLALRLPHLARLGLLLTTMPAHAFFAIAVMSSDTVLGGTYYRLLDRPFSRDLLDDQYLGGSITWALSEVPLLIVLIALLLQWWRDDQRAAARYERQAARDDYAELAAYNDWLASVSAGGNGGGRPRSSGPSLGLGEQVQVGEGGQDQDPG